MLWNRLIGWSREEQQQQKEMNPALYKELTFSWKRKIVQIVLEHNSYEKLVLNFDQTSFGFTSPNLHG